MAEGSTFDLHIYVNETIYTTLKHKADRLGVTISQLVRSYIINELDRQVLSEIKGAKICNSI